MDRGRHVDVVHPERARDLCGTGFIHLLQDQHVGFLERTSAVQQRDGAVDVPGELNVEADDSQLSGRTGWRRHRPDENGSGRIGVVPGRGAAGDA